MLPLTRRLAAPTLRPLTLEQVKTHLRADLTVVYTTVTTVKDASAPTQLVVFDSSSLVPGQLIRVSGQLLTVTAIADVELTVTPAVTGSVGEGTPVETGSGYEDADLLQLIDDVAAAFERESKLPLMAAEYVSAFPDWGKGTLAGLVAPVASVLALTYPDPLTGDPVPLAADTDYALSEWVLGQLTVKTWASLPAGFAEADAVRVRYLAGYATPAEVPGDIRRWLLLCAGHWYENRQSVAVGLNVTEVPETCKKLMNLIRVPTI